MRGYFWGVVTCAGMLTSPALAETVVVAKHRKAMVRLTEIFTHGEADKS